MKALLSKDYLIDFDMKLLQKEIYDLFDNFNFVCELVDQNCIEKKEKNYYSFKNRKLTNSEAYKLIKIDEYKKYIDIFNKKLEYLKSTFTQDELIIFKYGIEEREPDKVICDRICKTYKTYYLIKKSCFVKIALRFNLSIDAVNSTLERTFEIKSDF